MGEIDEEGEKQKFAAAEMNGWFGSDLGAWRTARCVGKFNTE